MSSSRLIRRKYLRINSLSPNIFIYVCVYTYSKYEQICCFLQICSRLLKKSLTKTSFFCAVSVQIRENTEQKQRSSY